MSIVAGKLLSFELGGGVDSRISKQIAITANRNVAGPWENIVVEPFEDGVSFRCGAYYLTAEDGGGGKLSTRSKTRGPWEKFYINSNGKVICFNKKHYLNLRMDLSLGAEVTAPELGLTFRSLTKSYKPSTDKVRAFAGNICGYEFDALPFKADPGPESVERVFWTPSLVCIDDFGLLGDLLDGYKDDGNTHIVLNLYNSSSVYRDWYPWWDEKKINKYLDFLNRKELVVVGSCFPDGSYELNKIVDKDLVHAVFWWEDPNPIVRPALDEQNKFWVARQFFGEKVEIYWHNPPYQEAPYVEYADWGLKQGDGSINGKVWNYICNSECRVRGILRQNKCWVDGWQNSVEACQSYIDRIGKGGMYGVDADTIDFEETAYYILDENGNVDQAKQWTQKIRMACPGLAGWCNG